MAGVKHGSRRVLILAILPTGSDVAQILYGLWRLEDFYREAGWMVLPCRQQAGEPEMFGVIFVGRPGTVGVMDRRALTLGVIIDERHQRRPQRLLPARRAAQRYVDGQQQARINKGRPQMLSGRDGDGSAERAARWRCGIFSRPVSLRRPVGRIPKTVSELLCAGERVALEIVMFGCDDAGAVEMPERPPRRLRSRLALSDRSVPTLSP